MLRYFPDSPTEFRYAFSDFQRSTPCSGSSLRSSSPCWPSAVSRAYARGIGIGITSTIALAGTLVSLAVTCVLAIIVAATTRLSGFASREAQTPSITAEVLDLRGLLLAGIVIGALGLLDDVTVSQVSTVAALRRANPRRSARPT